MNICTPYHILHCFILGGLILFALSFPIQAQITLDGTVGPQRILNGPNYTIDAQAGRQVGTNLFHSFGEFNVHTGEKATFTGPNSILNVIGRVTGGQVSNIDGSLRSEMPNANLYLLNPAGVMFGPNASLDVPGSFHVSTADTLKLADGGQFAAAQPEASLLTAAPPAAFGFSGPNPAAITIRGSTLQVAEGQTLSVIGGNLMMEGGLLRTQGGQLNLVSIGSAGEVKASSVDATSSGVVSELDLDGFSRLGAIDLLREATVDASGKGGGGIEVWGEQMTMDHSSVIANTLESVEGKEINLQLTGNLMQTGGMILAGTGGKGRAGDVKVEARRLDLTDGAALVSGTIGEGAGGNVLVQVKESVHVAGEDKEGITSLLGTGSLGGGPAGNLTVKTKSLTVTGGAVVAADSAGDSNAGNISIQATESVSLSGEDRGGFSSIIVTSTFEGNGRAGDLTIETKNLTINDGAVIAATTGGLNPLTGKLTAGQGAGGNLVVRATESVNLSGRTRNGVPSSLIASTGGDGRAGDLTVETKSLSVTNGALLAASSGVPDPRTGEELVGKGAGGNLAVEATGSVRIVGGGDKGIPSSLIVNTLGGIL